MTGDDPSATVTVRNETTGGKITEPLTVGTVGTVRERINVTRFSGAVTVRIRATDAAVKTQVTNYKDADGDGLWNAWEQRTWDYPYISGGQFRSSPYDNDTDGDGIPDGEEYTIVAKEDKPEYPGAPVSSVPVLQADMSSSPERLDTDGDGLPDPIEREGWNATITTAPSQSETVLDTLENQGRAAAVTKMDRRHVSSDPRNADTDFDGVDDLNEYTNRSDPQDSDSDGDGIPDHKELQTTGEVGLFDHTAPRIEIVSIRKNDATGTEYDIFFRLKDRSPFELEDGTAAGANFYKNGKMQYPMEKTGTDDTGVERVIFDVERSFADKIGTAVSGFFLGNSVDIRTRDVHGNSKRQTYAGTDTFGQAANVAADAPLPGDIGKEEIILLMGFSSGVTTASGESILGLAELINNPKQQLDAMRELATYLYGNWTAVKKLPELMLDSVSQTREQRNPFSHGRPAHLEFSASWSAGYLVGMVLTEFITASAGGTVASIAKRSSKLTTLFSGLRTASTAVKSASMRALGAASKVRTVLPDVDIDTGAVTNRLSGVSTAGRQRVVGEVDRFDSGVQSYIDETGLETPAAKASTLIKRTGSAGRTTLSGLAGASKAGADTLLRLGDDAAAQRASRTPTLAVTSPPARWRRPSLGTTTSTPTAGARSKKSSKPAATTLSKRRQNLTALSSTT
ncbi:hypothetical protein GJ629_02920 [Halapricum sp. CBA1109]|uniref:hypothetical protein n=1 Tax=Halapricum sp. CBA1109 TaxID=2668068 RepID=UPI0012FB1B0F|nr:hypothetical protein [Halapricum sp. CBA1109]